MARSSNRIHGGFLCRILQRAFCLALYNPRFVTGVFDFSLSVLKFCCFFAIFREPVKSFKQVGCIPQHGNHFQLPALQSCHRGG